MAKRAAANGQHTLSWARFRGRNGVDDPSTLPPEMAAEAMNWIITAQGLGERRRGTVKVNLTGSFTGHASAVRFIPGQNDAAAELVFSTYDTPTQFMRVAGGLAATPLTQFDNLIGSPQLVSYAVGNGKLFAAYRSTIGNRLHVYDPATGLSFRLAGYDTPGPPASATNTGSAAAHTPVLRHYRLQMRLFVGGVSKAVSALGAPLAFTPSGTEAAVRVTTATALSGATHWRLFGSVDGVLYYQLSDWLDLATVTFFDDPHTAPATSYPSLPAAPLEGSRYPLPSARFLVWDGTRLLLFGTQGDQTGNTLPAVPGRVYMTQALDATVEGGEDEAISMSTELKGYVDINRNGGSEDRALVGPVDGNILAMQSRGIYLLKPTGSFQRPYTRIPLSKELGCVSHWSSFVGEDEAGRPCIYWLDPARGPYRYGYDGLSWLGYDIQDRWKTIAPGSSVPLVAHGLYDSTVQRCYWWIVTGASVAPTLLLTFAVKEGRLTPTQGVRYGWTIGDGVAAMADCAVMFAETFGSPMARRIKPYLGYGNRLVQFDVPDINTDDDGSAAETPYQAYLRSKAWTMSIAPTIVQLDKAWVRASCSNAILAQTLLRNYGDQEDILSTVPLAPQGNESRRVFLFEDAQLAGVWTFQTQLGDAISADQFYRLDRWDARMTATDLEVGTSEL